LTPNSAGVSLQKNVNTKRGQLVELASLGLFTHESMHVRVELNEALTECEAVQRNYRAARLLVVPDAIAKRNALDYYNSVGA
jgi:hypothetical protein